MGSNLILGIVIAIVVLAAVVYGIGFFMRKKNQEKLKALEDRKKDLFDSSIKEDIDAIKKNAYGRTESKYF